MTSKQMRENPLFMRNNYNVDGKWGLPLVKNQKFDTDSRKKIIRTPILRGEFPLLLNTRQSVKDYLRFCLVKPKIHSLKILRPEKDRILSRKFGAEDAEIY